MDIRTITSRIESLLFLSGEAVSVARLAKVIGVSEEEVRTATKDLREKYQNDASCGFMLLSRTDHLLLATKPENASCVEALTKSALSEDLSKAALEVLSIIAYRSPITRSEIDSIRGVNCSFTLRNLMLRDLIEREGNPLDARGYVYRPSFRFLKVLGLDSIEGLPDFVALSQDERLTMILSKEGDGENENKEHV